MELKRVTRVKPIDSFSARWDSIVERVLAASQQQQQQPPAASHENGGTQLGQSSAANGSARECYIFPVVNITATCAQSVFVQRTV